MNEKMLRRFSDWLFAHGSEVLATTNDYEVIRFTTQLGIAVLYRNKDGEITKGINGAQDAFNAFLDQGMWEGGGKRERRPRNARERNLLIRSIAERDGWVCMYCGRVLTPETATVEHIVPLAGNGLDSLRNLTLACASCNNEAGHLSARQKLDLAMRRRLLTIANELQEIRDELDGRRLPRT